MPNWAWGVAFLIAYSLHRMVCDRLKPSPKTAILPNQAASTNQQGSSRQHMPGGFHFGNGNRIRNLDSYRDT